MNSTKLLEKVQYIIDENGQKSAVIVSKEQWEQLLTYLEDLEDAEEMKTLQQEDHEIVTWEKAKIELGIEDV